MISIELKLGLRLGNDIVDVKARPSGRSMDRTDRKPPRPSNGPGPVKAQKGPWRIPINTFPGEGVDDY